VSSNQFRNRIRKSIADSNLQIALDANAQRRRDGRLAAFASLPDHPERRARAHAVKADVVAHLDEYLAQFIANVEKNGILVHRAKDAEEAVALVLEIARKARGQVESRQVDKYARKQGNAQLETTQLPNCPTTQLPNCPTTQLPNYPTTQLPNCPTTQLLVAKSKSMVSEEINLNDALAKHNIRAVETDLGEYIVQLRGERPSHIITPAVHLHRQEVGQLFAEKLGIPYTENIPTLTNTARKVLREVFLTADIGLSGVNFGVAETGALCIVTNEGNGRMVTTLPPVHIALMGIERLVPTMDDLALFLSLLPRSATGQKLSVYTSLINAPLPGQTRHLILLDNGRSALRHSPLATSLYCIRCGACLNACPVFRELGGHAYGSIYPGPIGSVIASALVDPEFAYLAQASSLCGACREACPVNIDLPGLLLRVRAGFSPRPPKNGGGRTQRDTKEGDGIPLLVKLGLHFYRLITLSPALFSLAQRTLGLLPLPHWIRLPAFTGWGYSKDFPRPAARPFRARWKELNREELADRSPKSIDFGNSPTTGVVGLRVPDMVKQFTAELNALGGHVIRVTEKDAHARLAEFLRERGIERVLVDDAAAGYVAGAASIREPDPTVRAGVTGALAGIAETGSVLLASGAGQTLTASLLPEIHVAVLKTSQIVPTVAEALTRPEFPRAAAGVIVTGPSRTADIEMALTIGVHGPGELVVFLIDDSGTV
jgi:L-lactate dehydrogenase complex protein LldF